jgi:NAD(P)-dependent dehydrogenase (short-subunit alcohol dehydrogenase family)
MSNRSPFSLENKVIVVTGATGVLGKHFCLAIAEAGGKVVVMGRNKERAEACVQQIESIGG